MQIKATITQSADNSVICLQITAQNLPYVTVPKALIVQIFPRNDVFIKPTRALETVT